MIAVYIVEAVQIARHSRNEPHFENKSTCHTVYASVTLAPSPFSEASHARSSFKMQLIL